MLNQVKSTVEEGGAANCFTNPGAGFMLISAIGVVAVTYFGSFRCLNVGLISFQNKADKLIALFVDCACC